MKLDPLHYILINRYIENEGNVSDDELNALAHYYSSDEIQINGIIDTLKGFWKGLYARMDALNKRIWEKIWGSSGQSKYRRAYANTAKELDKEVGRNANKYAKEYFQKHGMELVKTLSETDIKRFKIFLGRPDVWGDGLPNFEKILNENWGVSKARAKLIVENEIHEAMMAGERDYIEKVYSKIKHPDARLYKTWKHSHRTHPRPMHIAIDNQTVEYDRAFSNGLVQPGGPGCQCHLEYSEKIEYKNA